MKVQMKIRQAVFSAVGVTALFVLLMLPSKAFAVPFTEPVEPAVPGNNLPGSATLVDTSPGAILSTISGTLGGALSDGFTPDDADMFRLFIDPAFTLSSFSATTSPTPAAPFVTNPQLFLFDSAGGGIYGNDDDGPFTDQSTLPLSGLPAGEYLLLITRYDLDPDDGFGLIFGSGPGFDDTTVFPIVGAGPITAYTSLAIPGGLVTPPEDYTITLTGATFLPAPVAVPEPATFFLFGSGLIGLVLIRKRSTI